MEIKDVLVDIEKVVWEEHQVKLTDTNRGQMMMALKKLYGAAYKSGMEEGVNVSKQFDTLRNKP